ncbi:MAG: FmdB family zinc ribbon protein [Candidatus Rokuibacteriota bacterium]
MPTYDYECESCERTYEVRQRISADALTTCQYCGGPVHRLLAPAPFILKGSGWHVTDYPSESRKKAIESEKKSALETAGTSTSASSSPAAETSTAASPSPPSSSPGVSAPSPATKD